MPQRDRVDLGDVAAPANLAAALWSAARGKRARPDVAAVLADAPRALEAMRAAVLAGRLPDGRMRAFAIRDPKPRVIHAAPFVDRVVHHALMRLLEPRLERALVPTTFACRPGLGLLAALRHAQTQMARGRHAWTLKLDVRHCFPSIEHARLLALLDRRFKGSAMVLVRAVLAGHAAAPGRGLPIGALTSQHFANQYLGELDRAALASAECLAHVRYMDDIVLWCASRDDAQALHDRLAAFADDALGLTFKPPAIGRCDRGLVLCATQLGPRGPRPGARRRRAWADRWHAGLRRWQQGIDDDDAHARACSTLRALAMPDGPAAAAWRRRVLRRRPFEHREPDTAGLS